MYTSTQIAEITGVNINTVKVWLTNLRDDNKIKFEKVGPAYIYGDDAIKAIKAIKKMKGIK